MQNWSSRAAGLCVIAACIASSAVNAQVVNVSKIATGTYTAPYQFTEADSGATYKYFTTGRVKVSGNNDAGAVSPAFTAISQNALQFPDLSRQVNNPADVNENGDTYYYPTPYARQAMVNMQLGANDPTKFVKIMTYKTGSGESVISYSIRIDHYSATSMDYFISLNRPQLKRYVQAGYNINFGDYNGGTYAYIKPSAARSRAAVDIYVDGLPVWSTERAYMFPKDHANTANEEMQANFGSSTPGSTTLYLGRLSTGKSMTITYVARVDADVTANTCGISSEGFGYKGIRCFDLKETVELPHSAGAPASFSLYSVKYKPLIAQYPF